VRSRSSLLQRRTLATVFRQGARGDDTTRAITSALPRAIFLECFSVIFSFSPTHELPTQAEAGTDAASTSSTPRDPKVSSKSTIAVRIENPLHVCRFPEGCVAGLATIWIWSSGGPLPSVLLPCERGRPFLGRVIGKTADVGPVGPHHEDVRGTLAPSSSPGHFILESAASAGKRQPPPIV